jgi:hypothetical protein
MRVDIAPCTSRASNPNHWFGFARQHDHTPLPLRPSPRSPCRAVAQLQSRELKAYTHKRLEGPVAMR